MAMVAVYSCVLILAQMHLRALAITVMKVPAIIVPLSITALSTTADVHILVRSLGLVHHLARVILDIVYLVIAAHQ